jgi:hypothetical protein
VPQGFLAQEAGELSGRLRSGVLCVFFFLVLRFLPHTPLIPVVQVFLFNDLLLVAKEKSTGEKKTFSYVCHWMLAESRVIDVADKPGSSSFSASSFRSSLIDQEFSGFTNIFGIASRNGYDDQVNFMCSSYDEKSAWMANVKKLFKKIMLKGMSSSGNSRQTAK